jgi:hypothetical protein
MAIPNSAITVSAHVGSAGHGAVDAIDRALTAAEFAAAG